MKHLPPGTPYFFYLGQGDTELEPDVVQTPFEDVRAANAHKTHHAFRLALQHDFDWLFRVDDDTFVVPERIPSLFWNPKAEMIGGECMWQWGWSTGGAGLLFTRRLIQHMVDAGIGTEGGNGDDGWACWRARLAGAQFYWTPRLRHQGDIRPHPNNDTVTGHYVSPREMDDAALELLHVRPLGRVALRMPVIALAHPQEVGGGAQGLACRQIGDI